MTSIPQQFDQARKTHPYLAASLDFYAALYTAEQSVQPTGVPDFTDNEVQTLLESGQYLLSARPPQVDWQVWSDLFRQVANLAASFREDTAPFFAGLHARADSPDMLAAAQEYLLHNRLPAEKEAPLMEFAFIHTFHPTLNACARKWEGAYARHAANWYRKNCPICGGDPDFAIIQSEDATRWLICSRCDAEWQFHRSGCPFCGERSAEKWGYYATEDRQYRLYLCHSCQHHLKAADLRVLGHPLQVTVLRPLTMDMDIAALDAWGIEE